MEKPCVQQPEASWNDSSRQLYDGDNVTTARDFVNYMHDAVQTFAACCEGLICYERLRRSGANPKGSMHPCRLHF